MDILKTPPAIPVRSSYTNVRWAFIYVQLYQLHRLCSRDGCPSIILFVICIPDEISSVMIAPQNLRLKLCHVMVNSVPDMTHPQRQHGADSFGKEFTICQQSEFL